MNKSNRRSWLGPVLLVSIILAGALILRFCFGLRFLLVMTGSMEPEIPRSSILIVEEAGVKDLSPGDIAVFDYYGREYSHRIIKIIPGHIITKGDAYSSPDPKIKNKEVKGKVTGHIPYGVIILILVFVLTLFMSIKIKKTKRKQK